MKKTLADVISFAYGGSLKTGIGKYLLTRILLDIDSVRREKEVEDDEDMEDGD